MHRKEDPKDLLNTYLKKLWLATIRECYQQVAQRAQQEAMSYEEYLLELLELECRKLVLLLIKPGRGYHRQSE